MQIAAETYKNLNDRMSHMDKVRAPWWSNWRDISDFFLPRRYPWLLTDKEVKSAGVRNARLLDSTSITALRTLATGMMNGITSPARPWFRLRIAGFSEESTAHAVRVWLDEASRRMLLVMAESNFYNGLGILYLEWCAFGTAAMSIYEDSRDIIRTFNHAVGEFYLETDAMGRISAFSRKFRLTVEQTVKEFGIEDVSQSVKADYVAGGVRRFNLVYISHLIERNDQTVPGVRASADWREFYWQIGGDTNLALRIGSLDELPPICPRWETYADDVYGSSPCMDAAPDVRQLQQMVKRRGQGLDKLVDPPMLMNKKLASQPKSTLPGGVTYVPGGELGEGARPLYQISFPFQELNMDIATTQARIRQVLFNDLFRMISELETVRSATEIDARREEKLVLLGPVLERFESEGLAPCIERIFRICERTGVFPPAPPELENLDIQIQYVSVLSDAQRAVGTVSIERYLQLIGNMASIFPEALEIPNPEEIIREYAEAIGVSPKLNRSREEAQDIRDAREQEQQISQAAEQGQALIGGAEQLSNTQVGGGQNALQALLG